MDLTMRKTVSKVQFVEKISAVQLLWMLAFGFTVVISAKKKV